MAFSLRWEAFLCIPEPEMDIIFELKKQVFTGTLVAPAKQNAKRLKLIHFFCFLYVQDIPSDIFPVVLLNPRIYHEDPLAFRAYRL